MVAWRSGWLAGLQDRCQNACPPALKFRFGGKRGNEAPEIIQTGKSSMCGFESAFDLCSLCLNLSSLSLSFPNYGIGLNMPASRVMVKVG